MAQPVPARHGRGIAVGEAFGCPVCAIVESTYRLRRYRVAPRRHGGRLRIAVNPNSVEAQMQGADLWPECRVA